MSKIEAMSNFGIWNLDFGIFKCGLQIAEYSILDLRCNENMNEVQMKNRTKQFAKEIIKLCRNLPNDREGRLIGNQVFRSGTSVAANYRASCRAKSKADFISKLAIVEEEADETLFWFELIKEMKILDNDFIDSLIKENSEIIAIIVASIKTVRKNRNFLDPKSKIQNPK